MEYYEYNVNNPRNSASGGKIYITLKKTALVMIMLTITLFLILMPWKTENVPTSLTVLYNILIICIVELPLLGGYFIFNKLAKRYFEYDYFILGDVLKIVRIQNKISRKSVLEIDLSNIENIGVYNGESYKVAVESVSKEISFACNENSDFYLYVVALNEGKRELYVLEYDFGFVTALRKALKRETVFDKDLIGFLKNEQKKFTAANPDIVSVSEMTD